MDLETLRNYCLALPAVTEELPFGPDTLVFKVCGRMFALTGLDEFVTSVNLKCDPEYAIELREQYNGVNPGWHMNKIHWNTVMCNDDVPQKLIFELIDHSYKLITSKLTKKEKELYNF
jgi:predicted DNA-binding protein (MmcQ/YjbR family)